MSRWLPWLAELQPELFVRDRPEHAAEMGVHNTELVQITTPRGSIRAKALVTGGIRPFPSTARRSITSACPGTGATRGLPGDVVNDLSALVGDPNVTIHEAKVFVCNVSKVRVA